MDTMSPKLIDILFAKSKAAQNRAVIFKDNVFLAVIEKDIFI